MPMNPTQNLTVRDLINTNILTVIENVKIEHAIMMLKAAMNDPKITEETFNVKLEMLENHHAQTSLRNLRKLYFGEQKLNLESMGEPVAHEEVQRMLVNLTKNHLAKLVLKSNLKHELNMQMQNFGDTIIEHYIKADSLEEEEMKERLEQHEKWNELMVAPQLAPVHEQLQIMQADRVQIHNWIRQIVERTKQNTKDIKELKDKVDNLETKVDHIEIKVDNLGNAMNEFKDSMTEMMQLLRVIMANQKKDKPASPVSPSSSFTFRSSPAGKGQSEEPSKTK